MARRQRRSGPHLTLDFQPVLDAAELLHRADKDFVKRARRNVARDVVPLVRRAMTAKARDKQSAKIARAATVRGGKDPQIVAGSTGKIGEVRSRELVRQYEFGSYREYRNPRYASRRGSTAFTVQNRRTQRQLPFAAPTGRWFYPAMAQAGPALARAWVGAIAHTYGEAIDG